MLVTWERRNKNKNERNYVVRCIIMYFNHYAFKEDNNKLQQPRQQKRPRCSAKNQQKERVRQKRADLSIKAVHLKH